MRITRAVCRAASTIRSERARFICTEAIRTPICLHGTNEPETIGEKVSSGCIRLFNHDIIDLYDRVSVGAPVVVLQEAREPFRADAEADDLYSPAAPELPWPGFSQTGVNDGRGVH